MDHIRLLRPIKKKGPTDKEHRHDHQKDQSFLIWLPFGEYKKKHYCYLEKIVALRALNRDENSQ